MGVFVASALDTGVNDDPVDGKRQRIIGAHEKRPMIRCKDGFWLAIPTPAVGKSSKGGRITPSK
jgi:uncharacterized membrane protein